MAEINIPSDILNDLKTAGIPNGSEIPGAEEVADGIKKDSLERMTKVLTWGFSSLHNAANENGLPGFGKLNPAEVAELSGIVLEKHASEALLEKSPELMLGSIFIGVISTNVLAIRRKGKSSQEPSENEPNQGTENE